MSGTYVKFDVKTNWFLERVKRVVGMRASSRATDAGDYLRKRILHNISVPVLVGSGTSITRSKPGEYPRKETGDLKRSVVVETSFASNIHEVRVGTEIEYGLILETMLDRSFLLRTFQEEMHNMKGVIGGERQ